MENNIDPWLYPGCSCEVWDTDSPHLTQMRYFKKISGTGHKIFSITKDLRDGIPWENYKPIGTPWDFAPKKSDKVSIDFNGTCYFLFDYGNGKNFYMSEYKFPWHDCPDHLKGQVWQRPEWAK